MKTAGGVIAIIAGIFGVISAGATLLIGGMGTVLEAEGANTVIGLGWGGVAFSFLTIIFGALAIGLNSKVPGLLLVMTSIAGFIFGGTLVAIFMVLACIGGILVAIGAKRIVRIEDI